MQKERGIASTAETTGRKMLELSVEHRREVQNVKDLEGLTMTSILSSLSGTKQKNLEKEQKEAEESGFAAGRSQRSSGAGGKRIAVCGFRSA